MNRKQEHGCGFCFANAEDYDEWFMRCPVSLCLSASVCRCSTDSFYDTFHTMADMMYFCQMMAALEVINPLLGLVKSPFFPAMIQVRTAGKSVSCKSLEVHLTSPLIPGCVMIAGGREERHPVRYLRRPGGDAEQARGVLRLLPVEHHRDLQVRSASSAL